MSSNNNNNVENEVVGIDDVTLEVHILPGFVVASSYNNLDIVRISEEVIKYSIKLTVLQIVFVLINNLLLAEDIFDVITGTINIILYILVCKYAIRCVQKKNKVTLCCDMTSLDLYRVYLYATGFIITIRIIAIVLYSIFANEELYFIIFLFVLIFPINIAMLYYNYYALMKAKLLNTLLNQQIYPRDTRSDSGDAYDNDVEIVNHHNSSSTGNFNNINNLNNIRNLNEVNNNGNHG